MIKLEKLENKIAILYLDNPPLNLITLESTQQLKYFINEIDKDDSIKVVIITGEGNKAFSAGSDINEFYDARNKIVEKKLDEENQAFLMIENLSKPVIAALNGITIGGGCEIALACDIRVMEEDQEIGLPEIDLGVFPGSGGIYRLPKIVGKSNALNMMYTGKTLDSNEAYRIGLVNYITEKKQSLEFAISLANSIAEKPKIALKSIKDGVNKTLNRFDEENINYNLKLSDDVFKTNDCKEGIDAFFDKRKPEFD